MSDAKPPFSFQSEPTEIIRSRSGDRADRTRFAVGAVPATVTVPKNAAGERYRLEAEIGRGGMGVVYKATDLRLKRKVAIKMILAGGPSDTEHLDRLRAEAEAVARLQHPHIVQIYDYGEVKDRPYLALELVDGESLAWELDGEPQPPGFTAEILQVVARAIHYAHVQGIVHRDLKPANIMLAEGKADSGSQSLNKTKIDSASSSTVTNNEIDNSLACIPKVMDFGLAKVLDSGPDDQHTRTGTVLGSGKYMAPEQAEGRVQDVCPATDVYAIGVILYEMLTGRAPFIGAGVVETMRLISEQEPVPPRRIQPDVPSDLETICLKCLQKPAGQRYETAEHLADDLNRWLTGEPILARPANTVERFVKWTRRRPTVAVLSFLLLAVVVGAFGIVLSQWRFAMNLAESNMQLAEGEREARVEADAQRQQAEQKQQEAAHQLRLATAARLAAQANAVRKENPALSALLAVESVERSPGGLDELQSESYEALLASVAEIGGVPLAGHTGVLHHAAFSPGSTRVATACWDGGVRVYDLTEQKIKQATLTGHQGRTFSVAFNGEDQVATGGDDQVVRLWDLSDFANPQCSAELEPQIGILHAAQFAPNGQWLAAAGNSGNIGLWRVDSGELEMLQVLGSQRRPVRHVVFSPDSQWLVACGDDSLVQVWQLNDETDSSVPMHELRSPGQAMDVEFSRDGTRLLVGYGQGVVRVWEVGEWDAPRFELGGHAGPVTSANFTPDGRRVVTTCGDASMHVFDLDSLLPQAEAVVFQAHGHYAASGAVSPGGRWAVSVAADAGVHLWDLTLPRIDRSKIELKGHRGFVGLARFSPDGRWLVTGGWDTPRLWDMQKPLPSQLPLVFHGKAAVHAVHACSEQRWLVAGDAVGNLKIWNLREAPRQPQVLRQHRGRIAKVFVSEAGQRVVTASDDQTVRLWNMTDDESIVVTDRFRRRECLKLSGDRRYFAVGTKDGVVIVRNFEDDQERVHPVFSESEIRALAVSHDGQRIACGSGQGEIVCLDLSGDELLVTPFETDDALRLRELRFCGQGQHLVGFTRNAAIVWDVETRQQIRKLPFAPDLGIVGMAVSPDGNWIAVGGWSKAVQLWGSSSDDPIVLEGHDGVIDSMDFSQDGKWLVTGCRDATIRLWNMNNITGQSPVVLRGHFGTVNVTKFLATGRHLLTAANDDTIRLWDLDASALMTTARDLAGRQLSPLERQQFLKEAPTEDDVDGRR